MDFILNYIKWFKTVDFVTVLLKYLADAMLVSFGNSSFFFY